LVLSYGFADELSECLQNPYWAIDITNEILLTKPVVLFNFNLSYDINESSISLLVLVQIALGEMVKTGELHKHTTRIYNLQLAQFRLL
jgi:hypothetical protein